MCWKFETDLEETFLRSKDKEWGTGRECIDVFDQQQLKKKKEKKASVDSYLRIRLKEGPHRYQLTKIRKMNVTHVSYLSISAMPSFLIKPTNQEVGRGRTATLQCVVTGNPPPTVFWSKGKEQVGSHLRHQSKGQHLYT